MIPSVIDEIVKSGVEVTIQFQPEIGVVFNLNTEAKSHLWLKFIEDIETGDYDECIAYMRYDEIKYLPHPSLHDIATLVADCMQYRTFVNYSWRKLMDDLQIDYFK